MDEAKEIFESDTDGSGYTNIVESGGILDWTGEIVRNGKR